MSPYAVRLTWDAEDRFASGFAIDVERDGRYVRAAIVDPQVREFVHHHRLPERSYVYRIRSFNPRGVSAATTAARTRTPSAPSTAGEGRPSPCSKLPPELPPEKVLGIPRQELTLRGGPALYDDPDPADAHRRRLFGEYEGCLRELGAVSLQADLSVVPGYASEGFPLLRGIAGAGEYAGAQIVLLAFSRGRYTVVDVARYCGAPRPNPKPNDPGAGTESDGDLAGQAPPFETCQRDAE
ncbi:MAG TPA: hypothetical protein VGK73_25075 [Polyangiaceae bacterium]